jgi:hypothetical protein
MTAAKATAAVFTLLPAGADASAPFAAAGPDGAGLRMRRQPRADCRRRSSTDDGRACGGDRRAPLASATCGSASS